MIALAAGSTVGFLYFAVYSLILIKQNKSLERENLELRYTSRRNSHHKMLEESNN